MDEVRIIALEWMAKAKRDLEAAQRMIDCADPLLDTGTYHCQQAAEKALKGWLTFRSVSVTKTHDLVHLVRECQKLDAGFQELFEMADFLSPFAVVDTREICLNLHLKRRSRPFGPLKKSFTASRKKSINYWFMTSFAHHLSLRGLQTYHSNLSGCGDKDVSQAAEILLA